MTKLGNICASSQLSGSELGGIWGFCFVSFKHKNLFGKVFLPLASDIPAAAAQGSVAIEGLSCS